MHRRELLTTFATAGATAAATMPAGEPTLAAALALVGRTNAEDAGISSVPLLSTGTTVLGEPLHTRPTDLRT